MSDKELMTLSASEQDECRQYIAWTTGGPEPDWKNMATWLVKCADNRKQNAALRETIARLEREKGLLQSFVIGGEGNCKHIFESMYVQSGAGDYFSCFLCSKCGGKLPPGEAADVLNAIDGGALE